MLLFLEIANRADIKLLFHESTLKVTLQEEDQEDVPWPFIIRSHFLFLQGFWRNPLVDACETTANAEQCNAPFKMIFHYIW